MASQCPDRFDHNRGAQCGQTLPGLAHTSYGQVRGAVAAPPRFAGPHPAGFKSINPTPAAPVGYAQEAIKSGVSVVHHSLRQADIAGYKNSIIKHPAAAGTAPCPLPPAQRTCTRSRVGNRAPNPNSTTRATPSARCCTKPLPNILRPGMRWPVPASSTGRVTTTRQSPLCARPFANIWNAASLPTALPAPAVMTAGMTTLWPSPAKAGESAPQSPFNHSRSFCGIGNDFWLGKSIHTIVSPPLAYRVLPPSVRRSSW